MTEELNPNQTIIDELLGEYKEQRTSLKAMIVDLEILKKNINKLFPENMEKRFMRLFEERVKTATGLFNAILDIRKELSRILKDEIDLRRKTIITESDEEILEQMLDIRALSKKVEKLKKSDIEEKKVTKIEEEEVEKPDVNVVPPKCDIVTEG